METVTPPAPPVVGLPAAGAGGAGGTLPVQAAPPAAVPPAPAAPPAPSKEPETILGGKPAEVKPGEKAPEVKPEAKKEEPKKDEKPTVPEKYDLKPPAGSLVAAPHLEKIAAFARERGFSQEQAQALVEHESASLKTYIDGQVSAFRKTAMEDWPKVAESHPDLGGGDPVKFKESVALANRALERFAPPELVGVLRESGYGNHPDLVRAWRNVGKAMAEDKFIAAPAAAQGSDPEKWRKVQYDKTQAEG